MAKWVLVFLALGVALQFALGGAAYAQGRGRMPIEIPMPRQIEVPHHEDRVVDPLGKAEIGLQRAEIAQAHHLSLPQIDRAAALAKSSPADYELDPGGALLIRGEVIATGLDTAALTRLKSSGFDVLRQSALPELGITLAVIGRNGMSAPALLKRLRDVEPHGSYELNQVFFESASPAAEGRPTTTTPRSDSGHRASVVGLIDTGVSPRIDSERNVRVMRRDFAPSESVPTLHGTAVAELLARPPGELTIFAADIFGTGPRGGSAELLVRALAWMASQHVPVINVSIVGPSNAVVGSVIHILITRGFVVVAPVGNDGAQAQLLFPASYAGVVAVSGAAADGRLLPEASRVKRVDFVAPGIATVRSPQGKPTMVRGTSFAAPVIARRLADEIDRPDPRSAKDAIDRLSRSAVRPRTERKWYGKGLVE